MANEGICLDALETFTANKNSSLARIVNCADTARQLWLYDFKTQHIIQPASNNCLTAASNVENALTSGRFVHWGRIGVKDEESKFNVSSAPCTADSKLQKWALLPFEWK